jgi:hypothetical protein
MDENHAWAWVYAPLLTTRSEAKLGQAGMHPPPDNDIQTRRVKRKDKKGYGHPRTKPAVGVDICAPFSMYFASRAPRNAVVRAHLINATKPPHHPQNENEKKKKLKQKHRKAKEETER